MWNAFISVIFKVIAWITTLILSPILAIVSVLIPSYSTYIGYFNSWLGYGLTYLNFFIDLFMIPRAPIIAVMGLGLGIITFNITMRVVGLTIAIWKYFKP